MVNFRVASQSPIWLLSSSTSYVANSSYWFSSIWSNWGGFSFASWTLIHLLGMSGLKWGSQHWYTGFNSQTIPINLIYIKQGSKKLFLSPRFGCACCCTGHTRWGGLRVSEDHIHYLKSFWEQLAWCFLLRSPRSASLAFLEAAALFSQFLNIHLSSYFYVKPLYFLII